MRFKTSDESLAEALFFRLYNSYLIRDPGFRDNYGILLDHYQKHPESFKILSRFDLLRLKQMQDDIKQNRYSLFSGSLDFSEVGSEAVSEEKSKHCHRDLCNRLTQDLSMFKGIIPGKIVRCFLEHPCIYGSIDIMLSDDSGVDHIIEVKTEMAKHDIIGQVAKYFVAQSLKLNLRLFYDVRMITMCPSYSAEALNGLRQIGAKPFVLNTRSLSLTEL